MSLGLGRALARRLRRRGQVQEPAEPVLFQCRGIDWRPAEIARILGNVLPRYQAEFARFPRTDTGDPAAYFSSNPYFALVDAAVCHALLRERKPPVVLEVGSGFSSRVIKAALRQNGGGRLVCVDPDPRIPLVGVADEHRAVPIQQIPLRELQGLPAGSVLFIDSSHRAGSGSDVNFLLLEVLPALPAGTLVHVHDIYLPEDYPAAWNLGKDGWNYTEQYLLHALLAFNPALRVVWPGRYVLRHHAQELSQLFPGDDLGLHCSFWFERVAAGGHPRRASNAAATPASAFQY